MTIYFGICHKSAWNMFNSLATCTISTKHNNYLRWKRWHGELHLPTSMTSSWTFTSRWRYWPISVAATLFYFPPFLESSRDTCPRNLLKVESACVFVVEASARCVPGILGALLHWLLWTQLGSGFNVGKVSTRAGKRCLVFMTNHEEEWWSLSGPPLWVTDMSTINRIWEARGVIWFITRLIRSPKAKIRLTGNRIKTPTGPNPFLHLIYLPFHPTTLEMS